MDAVEGADEGIDTGGVAGEFREVFDTIHHTTSGIGEGEHEALVCDELFHTRVLATRTFGGILELGRAA